MSAKYNMTIFQGSTFTRNITWKDSTGTVMPLLNLKARMQIRHRTSSGDLAIDLDNIGKGGITLNTTSNIITVKITATQTTAMTYDTYVYSLEVEDLVGTVHTLIYGNIKLIEEVTR
jgi:hypothetical protein